MGPKPDTHKKILCMVLGSLMILAGLYVVFSVNVFNFLPEGIRPLGGARGLIAAGAVIGGVAVVQAARKKPPE